MHKIIVEIEWEIPDKVHYITSSLIRDALYIYTHHDTTVTPVWEEPKDKPDKIEKEQDKELKGT
jgi:hypothetical protein